MSQTVYIDGSMKKAHSFDAAFDLECKESFTLPPKSRVQIPSKVSRISLPEGTAGLVCSRSGLTSKKGVIVANSPGIIDSGYKSEVQVILYNIDEKETYTFNSGDRIAQFLILELANVEIVQSDDDEIYAPTDERGGTNGFGSSGVSSHQMELPLEI